MVQIYGIIAIAIISFCERERMSETVVDYHVRVNVKSLGDSKYLGTAHWPGDVDTPDSVRQISRKLCNERTLIGNCGIIRKMTQDVFRSRASAVPLYDLKC